MMLLTQEQETVRDVIHTFVCEAIASHAIAWDRDATFPKDVHRQLGELGAYDVAVPEELGGAGLDYLSLALVLKEIAVGDGGTSTIISVNNRPVCSMLMALANDAQKQQWLVPLARGEMLGTFYLAEPYIGSDASTLRITTARNGDHWVLNGVKQFITSGKRVDMAIVMAVTDKTAGKHSISAFLVPINIPGYIVARLEDRLGQHSSDTAQVVFEDCRIPADYPLGEEGAGHKMALSGLEGGRIGIAAQSVGIAHTTFEAALVYAKERESSGQPLPAHQAVQFRLAEVVTRVGVARQTVWHTASLKGAGLPCLKEVAMAKLNASETAERVCSGVIQVLDGYGYVSGFPVERIHRDVCVCQIYEDASDIQKTLTARMLVQAVPGKAQCNRGSTS